jgi:phosphoribosyl 1,2-cyclic phosphodiesterase|tara:strand:- start:884 stop:1714 length:831 start_codon:yes stop_codon:yes gene_type:complete
MSNLETTIKFWGVRGSFPSPRKDTVIYGGHTSCVEIRTSDNDLIILDMGTGMVDLGRALSLEENAPKSAHAIISHYHWDHLFGFLGFNPLFDKNFTFNMYGKEDKMTPTEIIQHIQNHTFWPVDMSMLQADINLNIFPNDGLIIKNNIKITSALHGHPNGANSYKIAIGDKIIAYSTDCEHPTHTLNKNIIENAQNSDILIHDAQYHGSELNKYKGWGHSSWEQAVEVAKLSNTKQLVLFHHDPFRSDDELYEIEQQAQKLFPNTVVAKQGSEIIL